MTIVAIIVEALADPAVKAALRDALGTAPVDPWVTVADAAREGGVRERVIRDAGRRGELHLGRGVVRRNELDRWLASRPTRAATTPANDTIDDEHADDRAAYARTVARIGAR